MDMAANLLGQLAPQQQDSVKSNWGELFNVMGGSKENVAMELAKQTVKAQLLGGGGSGGSGSGGGMASMLGGMSKMFGRKDPAKEESAAPSVPSNPMEIISGICDTRRKAAPFIGGLDNPNALMGFFMQGVMGTGATKAQSESSIFSMMKQVIFGLLGDKLPAQSFSQNNQAQGAWTNFLQLAAGAMKKQAT